MLKMRLQNGEKVGIRFHHDRANELTVCKIYQLNSAGQIDDNAEIAFGAAYCRAPEYDVHGKMISPGDQFNKEIGRKISLTRALEDADYDRSTRREVWRGYFGRFGRG